MMAFTRNPFRFGVDLFGYSSNTAEKPRDFDFFKLTSLQMQGSSLGWGLILNQANADWFSPVGPAVA